MPLCHYRRKLFVSIKTHTPSPELFGRYPPEYDTKYKNKHPCANNNGTINCPIRITKHKGR